MLYADTTSTFARLNIAATGNALLSGAVPSWGKIGLTTHVSGILPAANGGTGNASGNATTATALETPRNINGVAFDGTADITVTAAAGTLTGGTLAAGVTASSLTSVGTIGAGVWQGTAVAAGFGGTGITSYTVGDIVYASGASTLSKLADVATGNALLSGGVATAPAWGKVGLATHVSGTLPEANGGTGITSLGAGIATWLGTPSSANLRAALTDETGTGAAVFANSPTLVTPVLGVASGTSLALAGTLTGVTDLTTTGNTVLGNASTDTLDVGNGGIVKDASGNVGVGTSPSAVFGSRRVLHVSDSTNGADVRLTGSSGGEAAVTSAGGALFVSAMASTAANSHIVFTNGATTFAGTTERVRISGAGDLIPTLNTSAPTLSTNLQMVFTLTSNTNLRISVRGSDGVTRVANITLA
jgi:hypothetical protein